MKRELICIGCPMGCQLTAEVENGAVTSVTGNTCPRGDAYARRECVAPVRTVTGTVAIEGAALPVLPVRTSGEIPKALVFDVARALRTVKVQAPIAIGDVVLQNVCGTGANFPGMRIEVLPAAGEKCPRCWMHSTEANAEGLCPRCARVVAGLTLD